MSSATESSSSFLRAARAGNLDKLLEYLKGSIDINTSNANGLNALHLASKEGHVHVVKELLARGAAVDAATKKGNTALHIASLAGQAEVVQILVEQNAKVNVQSQNGFTPLYMAAQENHSEVVKFLLANSADHTLSTEDGFTPLAVALQQGHDRVVTVLLENDSRGKVHLPALHIAAKKDDVKATTLLLQNEHNADTNKNGGLVNDTTKSGFTPLHIACHYGNINVGRLLIDKGADINYKARNSITPLHVASKWGRSNMVELLLEAKANIDSRTRDGLTPLHCAARSGHDKAVDLLLERGALVTCKTKNGLTPLHMSSQGDHVDCARLLLYHKAPIDEVTVDYLTPLHVVAHCGNVKTAKLLLDRKCEVNARALNGFTPLHIACKKNRIKIVELLLKYGASLEATTESGLTPLHVASFMGHMNIVIFLIQHGSNPNNTTMRGETALHLAARANQTDIIRILLRNGAQVDHAKAREQQTALHISSRLGNVDNVLLLLQHGASPDAVTKDLYTPLHIAAKEGHDEVVQVLLEHGAKQTMTTKRGFAPLHVAAKYGNLKVVQMLVQRGTNPNLEGKNGLTPLHVATHYNRVNVALYLLEQNASPHSATKNGYTSLHIAAKKNQMDIATTLLEHGSNSDAESRNGFTPLHLAAQEGHTDMVALLAEHGADVNCSAKNGLTSLHLAAQEDHVAVAEVLARHKASIDPQTKAGYTPLHTACHFGQIGMIRFLLEHGAAVNSTTKLGYTPLHQAAQQGHVLVNNLLLKYRASPNAVTSTGQTPLSIAQRLGYISVVEILKNITEVSVSQSVMDEKYKVMFPETMQETPMSDSEEEGGEESLFIDQSFQYLTTAEKPSDENANTKETRQEFAFDQVSEKGSTGSSLGQSPYISDSHKFLTEAAVMPSDFQGLKDDNMIMSFSECSQSSVKMEMIQSDIVPYYVNHEMTASKINQYEDGECCQYTSSFSGISAQSYETSAELPSDRSAPSPSFLVSFMVDARGGAMRGCRHSGVRIIIPPGKACMPTRVTCRLVKKEKVMHPPALMEGEALASRILEMGPVGARFSGPVIIEVPHFASLRGKEREITILRSENGQTWREHAVPATEDAVHEALKGTHLTDLESADDLIQKRITRILTSDFPQYFAIVARVRQETSTIGPEGGMISSTVVPRVQAIFPEGSLTKNIKVSLQVQPVPSYAVSKMFGNRVAVSPIVTVEPRRRKFHKPITLTIPVPIAIQKGMLNQYGGETPTLRILCSIMGGTSPAQWEDITGTTPLTFINDCISFTTTVSARFWLMDCQNVNESAKMASELYRDIILVPFMAKFVVFAKRHDPMEAHLRVFSMTDDKMEKLLENRERFKLVARSTDVEVLEGRPQYIEMGGNLVPVTKSGDKLFLGFHAFRENRLPYVVRVRDINHDPTGLLVFMRTAKSEAVQVPTCTLSITLPDYEPIESTTEMEEFEMRYETIKKRPAEEQISKAELWLTDIADSLGPDWIKLAHQMKVDDSDITRIEEHYADDSEKALVVLHLWIQKFGERATGNELERVLRSIGHDDIVQKCMYNIEEVTDAVEKVVARVHLDSTSGFDALREELGSSRDSSLPCGGISGISLDASYEEQDIIKESESLAEDSSTTLEGNNMEDVLLDGEKGQSEEEDEFKTSMEILGDLKFEGTGTEEILIHGDPPSVEKHAVCESESKLPEETLISFRTAEQTAGAPVSEPLIVNAEETMQPYEFESATGDAAWVNGAVDSYFASTGMTTKTRDDNRSGHSVVRDYCQLVDKKLKFNVMEALTTEKSFIKEHLLIESWAKFDSLSDCKYSNYYEFMPQERLVMHGSTVLAGMRRRKPCPNALYHHWSTGKMSHQKESVSATLIDLFEGDTFEFIAYNFDKVVGKMNQSPVYYSAKSGEFQSLVRNVLPRQCAGDGDPEQSGKEGSTGADNNADGAEKQNGDKAGGEGSENHGGEKNSSGGDGSSGNGNPGDRDPSSKTDGTSEIQTRTEVTEDERVLPDGTRVKRKVITRTFWREIRVPSADGAGHSSPVVMEEIVRIEIDEEVKEIEPNVAEPFDENVESETSSELSEYLMSNGAPVKKRLVKTRFWLKSDASKASSAKSSDILHDAVEIEAVVEEKNCTTLENQKDQSSVGVETNSSDLVSGSRNVITDVELPVSKENKTERNPVPVEDNPVQVEGNPVQVEGNLVLVEGNPVQVKGNPVQVEGNPVPGEGSLVQVEGSPVTVFGDLVQIDGNPVQVEGNPVTVEENPVQTESMGEHPAKEKTEVTDDETVNPDGTRIKTRTLTMIHFKDSPAAAGEIDRIEIQELVTEMAPGVSEPFGEDVELQTMSSCTDYLSPDGVPVVKNTTKVLAHHKAGLSLAQNTVSPPATVVAPSSNNGNSEVEKIEVQTEVTEDETSQPDGKTIRKKIITKKYVKTLASASAGVTDETQADVVKIEIEEYVTEMAPGVSDPFDDDIDTETTTESAEYQLSNGTPVQRTIVKVIARKQETPTIVNEVNVDQKNPKNDQLREGADGIEIKTDIFENENKLNNGTTVKTRTTTKTFLKQKLLSSGVSVEEVVRTEIEDFITELAPGVTEPYGEDVETEMQQESEESQLPDGSPVSRTIVKLVASRKTPPGVRYANEYGSVGLAEVPRILEAAGEEMIRHHTNPEQSFGSDNVELRTDVTEDESILADGTVVKKKTTTKTAVKKSSTKQGEEIIETEIEERVVQMAPGITDPFGDNVETESSTESFRYFLENGSPVTKTVIMVIAHFPLSVSSTGTNIAQSNPPVSSKTPDIRGPSPSSIGIKPYVVVNGTVNGSTPLIHPEVAKLSTTVKKNVLYKKVRNVGPDGSITEDTCSFDEDGYSDTSSVSDIRDLSPFAFLSANDDLALDDYEPGSMSIQVCTSTDDAEPSVENDVKEYEDILPDGTVVHRTVSKKIERKTFVNHVVIHVPHASKPLNGDLALENYVEPYLAKYSHLCHGAPEITTDTQEFEDVLPDGTISKKRVTRKTEQQLSMERMLLIGNMPSLCGAAESGNRSVTPSRSNIPEQFVPGQGAKDSTALVASTHDLSRCDDGEQTARVILRKQIHKKTIIQGGKEETIVTEDTQIEQDTNAPQELTDSVQELIQQFLDANGEPGSTEEA